MLNCFVIQNVSENLLWEKLFCWYLNLSTHYEVVYPIGTDDPENPLLEGRSYFLGLVHKGNHKKRKHINENYFIISGPLTKEVKKYLRKLVGPSFTGDKSELWNFSLIINNNRLLTLTDFNVCLIEKTPFLQEFLKEEKVDTNYLFV